MTWLNNIFLNTTRNNKSIHVRLCGKITRKKDKQPQYEIKIIIISRCMNAVSIYV